MNGTVPQGMSNSCGLCGSSSLTEAWEEQRFPYGDEQEVELLATVPVLKCQSCGFSFTDDRAGDLRHDAVCRHEGLVTPADIRELRENVYRMSRKEFERAFGISAASLERWENRKLFPSRQASSLLRALSDRNVGLRLMEQSKGYIAISTSTPEPASFADRFPALIDSALLRAQARSFRLRLASIAVG